MKPTTKIQSPELIARGFLAFSVIQNQPTALTHSLSGMDTGDAIPYTNTQRLTLRGGETMLRMDKITTGISYGASGGSALFWLKQLLDGFSPEQWAAFGVLGSLLFGFLTFLTNLYFKVKEDRRKASRGE